MTSAEFASVLIDDITLGDRQRKDLGDVAELAESIKRLGLINAPVVTRELVLVAGERRLTACRSLGWDTIPIQYADTLDPLELHLLELEENTKRKDLSWTEHNDAIAAYHELRSQQDPEWTQAKTAEALNVKQPVVSKHLQVAEERKADPTLNEKQKFSEALSVTKRRKERKQAALEDKIAEREPDSRAAILNQSFLDWAAQPQDTKFNLLHVDFPYGVDATKVGQSAARTFGGYSDQPDDYYTLLKCLTENQDNFVTAQAHMIFWFSMNFYQETVDALTGAGWAVNPFPLIWHRNDNKGMLPDANRGPRRNYETALLCSRGDRKIVSPVSNIVAHPTEKHIHASEKPVEMLRHFMRMLVDEYTRVFDPTAGSGNAVLVGRDLGAAYSLGLELNPEYAKAAQENVNSA